jgi:hypothetical protein
VSRLNADSAVDCARCCPSMFARYERAISSTLMLTLTVTCRTNPTRMQGVIVRLCPLAWPTGFQGQVNPLASSETTVLKTRFGPGDANDTLSRSIRVRAMTECREAEGDFHVIREYLKPIPRQGTRANGESKSAFESVLNGEPNLSNAPDERNRMLANFGTLSL